jgi:hypothetical protein
MPAPGGVAPAVAEPAPGAPQAPAPQAAVTAREHYQAALDKLRVGDWEGFGREMDALGRALGE